MSEVIFTTKPGAGGDIGKIVLNRPQQLNVLTFSMCESIYRQLQQWSHAPAIKAVIIASSSERAFCAGGDVRAIYELCVNGEYAQALKFFQQEYAMNQAIFEFPKPYIAFLDGITMGGGVGLSIHGSHPIATEHLVWAMPETRIGFFPDVGAGYHLARLPHHLGYYLALTGERLTASDAYNLALVKAIIPRHRLPELEHRLITTPFDSTDFAAVTQLINQFHHQPVKNSSLMDIPRDQIDRYFSRPYLEDIVNDLQQSGDLRLQKTADNLLAQSPLSLKITYEHLNHCQQFDFHQVLAETNRLVKNFLHAHDFVEGVRALLIDKDHNPHWQPSTLAKISQEMLQSYF